MKKLTGVLFALLGTGLAASVALNVCHYYGANKPKKNVKPRKMSAPAAKPDAAKNAESDKELILKDVRSSWHDSNTVALEFNTGAWMVIPADNALTIRPYVPFRLSSESGKLFIHGDFQPETTYSFQLKRGLKSTAGEELKYDAAFQFKTPALQSELQCKSSGRIFPLFRKNQTLPLEIVNLDELKITVVKLHENKIAQFWRPWEGLSGNGVKIFSKTIPLKQVRNQKFSFSLDLTELIPGWQPGVYGLRIQGSDDGCSFYNTKQELSIALTDMAIQTVCDEAHQKVFAAVRSLKDGKAYPGVEVMLFSSKQQPLAKGITDASGLVRLDYSQAAAAADPDDRPFSVLAKNGTEYSFLTDLRSARNSLAEFNYPGNEESAAPRAMLYTERGVYRPGETVYLTSWIRKPDLSVYAGAPCSILLQDPNGNTIFSRTLKTDKNGLIQLTFPLPEDVPGGLYRFLCKPEDGNDAPVWGNASFLAADFVPDRIKATLKQTSVFSSLLSFELDAEYYFGGMVENAPFQFNVTAAPAMSPPEWNDWTIGDLKSFVAGRGMSSAGTLQNGKKVFKYSGFKECGGSSCSPVMLNASAQVREPGGRAVTASTAVLYHPYNWYLGLRSESVGKKAVLKWKMLPADVKGTVSPEERRIRWTLCRLEWHYVLKTPEYSNTLRREWEQRSVDMGTEVLPVKTTEGVWEKELPVGEYEMVAVCGDRQTRLRFFHWQGETGVRSANPAVLAFRTDKEQYRAGEQAVITVSSPDAGYALVALGERELADYQVFPVKAGANLLTVVLPKSTGSSTCYAGVTLISGEQRLFGLVRFKLAQPDRQLQVALSAPEKARPRSKVSVKVSLSAPDGTPQTGMVQFFAVDEGILALTEYRTPDIFQYFFGDYSCPFFFTDIYEQIYPDLKIGKDGNIGGDGVGASARKSARKVKLNKVSSPVSAVKVLAAVEVNGLKELQLELPDHLGAMRLMAVASNPTRAGSGERRLILRDNLDVMPSAPRVCAPGDETELTFTLLNHDLPDGKADFALHLPDGKAWTSSAELAKGKPAVVRTSVQMPSRTGDCVLNYELTMNGISKTGKLHVLLRHPNPQIQHTVSLLLKPGERWELAKEKLPEFAGKANAVLNVSASPAAVLKNSVGWLNRYPYGCLEQTTAAAFPLLSAKTLAENGVITPDMAKTATMKLTAVCAELQSMMLYNGAFTMWRGGTDAWAGGAVFAAHFLAECSNLGIPVRLDATAKYLQSLAGNAAAERYERAYACYVLALLGRSYHSTVIATARNLLRVKTDDFASLLAAAAMMQCGYSGEGYQHFKRLLTVEPWLNNSNAVYYSGEASRAGMTLYLLMKHRIDAPEAAAKLYTLLMRQLKPDGSGWGVTHANAWATLGLAGCMQRYPAGNAVAEWTQGAEKVTLEFSGAKSIPVKPDTAAVLENTGNTAVCLQYAVSGIPLKAEPVRGAMSLKRTYRNAKGKAVVSARQGELLTVELELNSTGDLKDVVLTDMLPGGLEIEDERFATRMKVSGKEADTGSLLVKQMEKRPGTFMVSGDLKAGKARIRYQARAVSRGKYAAGATAAEGMYAPEYRAFEPGQGIFEVK